MARERVLRTTRPTTTRIFYKYIFSLGIIITIVRHVYLPRISTPDPHYPPPPYSFAVAVVVVVARNRKSPPKRRTTDAVASRPGALTPSARVYRHTVHGQTVAIVVIDRNDRRRHTNRYRFHRRRCRKNVMARLRHA